MRKYLTSYIAMVKAERWGLAALGGAMLVLIAVRYMVAMNIKAAGPEEPNNTVALYQHEQAWVRREKKVLPEHQDASGDGTVVLPDQVNINKADSATLVLLKGVGPVTAHKIMERRMKLPFTDIGQLREVGSFNKEALTILMRHLTVTDVKQTDGVSH